jgi:hypothetical protein
MHPSSGGLAAREVRNEHTVRLSPGPGNSDARDQETIAVFQQFEQKKGG